jgi:hypothetical protein
VVRGEKTRNTIESEACEESRRFADAAYHQLFNSLTPNDLKRRRVVSPLKIKISSKNMREKPTNAQTIHSVC